jgi:hypothetical protein
VAILLINHTRAPVADLVGRWAPDQVLRVGIAPVLDLALELAAYRRLDREAATLRRLARSLRGLAQRVARRAAEEACSSAALENLSVGSQVHDFVARTRPAAIITTHEGHGWERIVWSEARRAYPAIRCLGYQHAAITRLQHSIRRRIGGAFDPDAVLAAGPAGARQLREALGPSGPEVHVLGSDRGIDASQTHARAPGDRRERRSVLVLPEGFEHECHLLFGFALDCAALLHNLTFILRLHPILSFGDLVRRNPRLRVLPANVRLSTESLVTDARRSAIALYRGTTAVIQAVGQGAHPVYVAVDGEMTIDPLHDVLDGRSIVSSPRAVQALLSRSEPPSVSPALLEACAALFTTFDLTVLEQQLPTRSSRGGIAHPHTHQ